MSNRNSLYLFAVSSALALAGVAASGSAMAADGDKEQCAGIIKAGKNDCATSKNQCHGHVTVDASPEAWIYLPKGTCDVAWIVQGVTETGTDRGSFSFTIQQDAATGAKTRLACSTVTAVRRGASTGVCSRPPRAIRAEKGTRNLSEAAKRSQ